MEKEKDTEKVLSKSSSKRGKKGENSTKLAAKKDKTTSKSTKKQSDIKNSKSIDIDEKEKRTRKVKSAKEDKEVKVSKKELSKDNVKVKGNEKKSATSIETKKTTKKDSSLDKEKKTSKDVKKPTSTKEKRSTRVKGVDLSEKVEDNVAKKGSTKVKKIQEDKETDKTTKKVATESDVLVKERRKRSKTSSTSSVVVDLATEGLDKTGAISKIDEGYISEIANNKLFYLEKIAKDNNSLKKDSGKNGKGKVRLPDKEGFDGKFRLDVLDVLIIVVITAIISCVFTGVILNHQYKNANNVVSSDKNVKEFVSLYNEILENFYEEVDADEMMKAAINGMVSFLEDNYSIYLNQEESSSIAEMLDSSYEGIGIVIQANKIVSIYKDSPAAKAGLKVNDEIVKINDNEVTLENYINIGDFMYKDKDNVVVVKRDGEEKSFTVQMSKVKIPTTSATRIQSNGKNLGYIKLTSFSYSSFEDFQESLMGIEKEGIDSLIIDLRSNSGGYLKAAYDIVSLFTEKDKVIYSLEQKNKVTAYKDETKEKKDYKVIVLVNNGTASASEVMAAALHDSYGATLVGKTTYGKGKVQTLKQYDDDSMVKYTSAKWLRPNGDCIDGIGIVPDYEVDIEFDDQQIYDKQLDKAIEILSN